MLRIKLVLASTIAFGAMFWVLRVTAEERAMDTARSSLKIRVLRSGVFSAFAHNHEIEAPIAEGTVNLSGDPSVALRVQARELRVVDPELSPDKRDEVQTTMQGSKVLDVKQYPEISFQSATAQQKDEQHWIVRGKLTLHGQTRPVEVAVMAKDNHYRGTAKLRQQDFGITPVAVAGGTVRVKDEVRVEFDIVLK
jgi:YceI-like domain